MKVVRTITYEGTPEAIRKQLSGSGKSSGCEVCGRPAWTGSFKDGTYNLMTKITVKTETIVKPEIRARVDRMANGSWWLFRPDKF